ncbi:unnamed protein product [Blepharisma stoltei]|uniref:START domain-containing protein n=1 Tax=Blepharisma stoltei TaxID=1481888 RepID=A0AAU9J4L4_9CILI|nr:unnamed protein product [Blepharisma stoltei]
MESGWVSTSSTVLSRALEEVKDLAGRSDWGARDPEGGVEYSARPHDDYPIARGIGEINAPLETCVQYFRNHNNNSQWSETLKSITVLQDTGNLKLLKSIIKARWPMSDRELLFAQQEFPENSGNTVYVIEKSVELAEYPLQKGYVRAHLNFSGYIFERLDSNRTRVTYIVQFNPEGMVPGFVREKMQLRHAARIGIAKKTFG